MTRATLRDGNVLHARIPIPSTASQLAGAHKYNGAIAAGYDAKREDSEKWKNEDRIITEWLAQLKDDGATSVLDCPVGTGRFLGLYKSLGLSVLGLDISADMLHEAAAKDGGPEAYLRIGDARDLGELGKYDVAICCRLMRWLEGNEIQLQVISELMRVANMAVIFNVRIESGPLPLDVALIKQLCAEKGWHIAEARAIVDDFTFFMLKPNAEEDVEAPPAVLPE